MVAGGEVEGQQPVFRVPCLGAVQVRTQQHPDGRKSVWEKWLEFTPGCLSLYARWDPGMMVHAHGHNSDHVVFVVEGEMSCGDVRCTAGMHITLEQGASFGPFVAGPEGVTLFEVMMGDPRSWAASTRDTTHRGGGGGAQERNG